MVIIDGRIPLERSVVGGSLEGYDREVWEIDAGILLNLYLTINKLKYLC